VANRSGLQYATKIKTACHRGKSLISPSPFLGLFGIHEGDFKKQFTEHCSMPAENLALSSAL
jgi:hypothetical protein